MRFPSRPRILRIGILFKLILVFTSILVIIYFTTSNIFDYQRGIVNISREVVKVRFEVHSISQNLVDSLLSMEENQKKYDVLRQDNYKEYFASAFQDYRRNLSSIQWFSYPGSEVWASLQSDFEKSFPQAADPAELVKAQPPWVPQEKLNAWREAILAAKLVNERSIESSMRELYAWSERAVRAGMIGLGVSMAVALLGSAYLTYSLFRPLRELRRGIRAFTLDGKLESVRVISRDELGELAQAFNEMTARLKEEEKMRTDFIDMLSHEIRTPLNGVTGMLQLLEATDLDPEQKECVLMAMNSSGRLTRLLSDILDLSRIEAGKLVMMDLVFQLSGQRKTVLDLYSLAAAEKGLELDFLVGEGMPPALVGDEARLRQIFFNLVGNAVKFTSSGRVRVEAHPMHQTGAGLRVLFTVSDTGIGISEEHLRMIFEPFVQAEGSYTRRFQGAGLGLSIVWKLVGLMGGEVAIDSEEGHGTTAYVTLPFRLPGPPAPQAKPSGVPAPAHSAGSLRILVVEDELVNSLAVRRFLEKRGHVVVTARDGREALECFERQQFDLVLMDIQMPVMNGLEAAKAIRDAARFGDRAGTPIVAMTGYAMTGDREKFLSAGMNAYLAKPVNFDELERVIGEVMGQGG